MPFRCSKSNWGKLGRAFWGHVPQILPQTTPASNSHRDVLWHIFEIVKRGEKHGSTARHDAAGPDSAAGSGEQLGSLKAAPQAAQDGGLLWNGRRHSQIAAPARRISVVDAINRLTPAFCLHPSRSSSTSTHPTQWETLLTPLTRPAWPVLVRIHRLPTLVAASISVASEETRISIRQQSLSASPTT